MSIFNIKKAAARIQALENQLGIQSGRPIFNIGKALARIETLEKMAGKPATPAPATPSAIASSLKILSDTPPTAYLATPVAAPASEIAPVTLAALAREVYGTDAAATFEAQRCQFTRSGLVVPGLAAATLNYVPQFVGLARVVRADRQKAVNRFFANKIK